MTHSTPRAFVFQPLMHSEHPLRVQGIALLASSSGPSLSSPGEERVTPECFHAHRGIMKTQYVVPLPTLLGFLSVGILLNRSRKNFPLQGLKNTKPSQVERTALIKEVPIGKNFSPPDGGISLSLGLYTKKAAMKNMTALMCLVGVPKRI